jgi:hypothetical protein
MLFIQNFPDPKSQKFFSKFFPPKILRPFYNLQDIYNQTQYIMDIPKLILDELNITIPVSENLGDSKENAIKISFDDTHFIVLIQNEIIDTILQEEPRRKTEQSLVFDECKFR